MISEVAPSRYGFCSKCDEAIVEVKREWSDEDKEGEPREFAAVMKGVKRTTLVLLSGSNMDWNFCRRCTLTPQDIPGVWKRMLMAGVVEISPQWRENHRMEPYTNRQQRAAIETVVGYFVDPPIGILGTRLWEEVESG